MIKYVFLICLFINMFFACNSDKEPQHNKKGLSVIQAYQLTSNNLSEEQIMKCTKIVRLETNDDCLLAYPKGIKMYGDMIFVLDQRDCLYSFDSTGKFLRQIGRIGQGPEEYYGITDFYIDREKRQIGLIDTGSSMVTRYTLEGKFVDKIHYTESAINELHHCEYIGNNQVLLTQANGPRSLYNYCVVNESDFTIHSFQLPYLVVGEEYEVMPYPFVSNAGKEIYVPSMFMDTIYRWEKGQMIPEFVVERGLKHADKEVLKEKDSYFIAFDAAKMLSKKGYSTGIQSLYSTDKIFCINYMPNVIFWNKEKKKGEQMNAYAFSNTFPMLTFQLTNVSARYFIRFMGADYFLEQCELLGEESLRKYGLFEHYQKIKEDDNPVIILHDIDKIIENIK